MGLLDVKPRELTRVIDDKVKPQEFRSGKESNYWYCVDGKRRFRVTVPKVHHGSSVPTGTLNQIRKSLQLTSQQFSELVSCSLSGPAYATLIKRKIDEGIL